jgi:hypothetical protein
MESLAAVGQRGGLYFGRVQGSLEQLAFEQIVIHYQYLLRNRLSP